MEWTNAEQAWRLLSSAGFGFLLGVYYELFRFGRRLFAVKTVGTFVLDTLWCVTAAFATFLFDLVLSGGQLRGYLFLGCAVGFAAYSVTVGQLVSRVTGGAVRLLRRAGRWFDRGWQRLADGAERVAAETGRFFTQKARIFTRIFQKKS